MSQYDVVVLGGGISGLGVAHATIARGHSTVVLEAKEVARATSSNTLRIIHGGFRYLQQLDLPRVWRSLGDQSYVAVTYSEAVAPLPCLMPLSKTGLKSRFPVSAAALLYGAIMRASRSPLPCPSVLTAAQVKDVAPILAPLAPYGALCWHDLVMTEPGALHSKLISTLRESGVEIREHTKAISVASAGSGFRVTLSDGEQIQAKKVINTLGPWLPTLQVPHELRGPRPKWCLGFNLLLNKQIHPTHAIAVQSRDGRLFFCVPRGSQTAVGTWYIPWDTNKSLPDSCTIEVPKEEIQNFLESFSHAFPGAAVNKSDLCGIDAGILPMRSMTDAGPTLYGAEILTQRYGYCEVISTKYTTFRSQGEAVARKIL